MSNNNNNNEDEEKDSSSSESSEFESMDNENSSDEFSSSDDDDGDDDENEENQFKEPSNKMVDEDEDDEDEDEDEDEDDKDDKDEKMFNTRDNIKINTLKEKIENDTDILGKFKKLADKLKEYHKNNTKSQILKDMIKYNNKKKLLLKQKKKQMEKKIKDKLFKKFTKISDDDPSFGEERYFKNNLDIVQLENTIEEYSQIKQATTVNKPYLIKLIESPIPISFKSIALKKIETLRSMGDNHENGEYYKIKNWLDIFMKIPFGIYNNLSVTLDDGLAECHEFMINAKNILDDAVFGLNDAKLQIMQLIGQWIVNPKAMGTAIAIKGPMGTGKTTLIKDGISKILNRPFSFIALGGATDSAFLEGHSYTYEGSMPGKIVDILVQAQCMNPIIYCDELDKLSDTPKGEEITGILTHLTDPAQNEQFHDKYFAELDFNLSRTLLIFSYNDESKINPILKDRMYRIETKGYTKDEKTTIANNYLLPKIQKQLNIEAGKIIIATEILHYIIEKYTEKEDGVRNLKRCLEIIYTKLNLYRLMKPGTNLFEKDLTLKIEFPNKQGESINLTEEMIEKLIKVSSVQDDPPFGMYN